MGHITKEIFKKVENMAKAFYMKDRMFITKEIGWMMPEKVMEREEIRNNSMLENGKIIEDKVMENILLMEN